MKPLSFMFIAGEPSGDHLAAELITALRREVQSRESIASSDVQPLHTQLAPRFFGAGGPKMAEAGAELAIDLTQHTVFGIVGVIARYFKFLRFRNELLRLAIQRQPDVVVGVDYSGFNRNLAAAIRRKACAQSGTFGNWRPKLVQFVSPQVWASRAGRVYQMQRDYDLILSIFPFEKPWYAKRVPRLRVDFVGHFLADRYPRERIKRKSYTSTEQRLLLLPGSRKWELKRHLPVVLEAAKQIQARQKVSVHMVVPNEEMNVLAQEAIQLSGMQVHTQVGGLHQALAEADVAIASSGTITLECAWFGVPTVVLYKVTQIEYEVASRCIQVPHIAMPNLLANERIYPEFRQNNATPEALSNAALEFLNNQELRDQTQKKLAGAVATLGGPGASQRAAHAVLSLLE